MNAKKTVSLAMAVCGMVLLLAGCGGKTMEVPTASPGEILLWSSGDRPNWTLAPPEGSNDNMLFSGASDTCATEPIAKSRSRMAANNEIAGYMGTLVKNKIEQARVDFGLASSVIDPTSSAREYTNQLAANYVSQVKHVDTYLEKWQTETGIGYRFYGLYSVPIAALNADHGQASAKMAAEAMRKAKAQSDLVAKQQLENASAMWTRMEREGLFN